MTPIPEGFGIFNVLCVPGVTVVMMLLSPSLAHLCTRINTNTHTHTHTHTVLMWPGISCKHLSTVIVNDVAALTTCRDIKSSDGAGLERLGEGFIPGNSHTGTQQPQVHTPTHTPTLWILMLLPAGCQCASCEKGHWCRWKEMHTPFFFFFFF